MRHFPQQGKRNCGQIAVAVLTGRTVEQIEAIVGHSHGTKTKELVAALRACNLKPFSKRCLSHLQFLEPPRTALCQVHCEGIPGWHWVALHDGVVYDGHEEGPKKLSSYLDGQPNYRITSFLPIGVLRGSVNRIDSEGTERLRNLLGCAPQDITVVEETSLDKEYEWDGRQLLRVRSLERFKETFTAAGGIVIKK